MLKRLCRERSPRRTPAHDDRNENPRSPPTNAPRDDEREPDPDRTALTHASMSGGFPAAIREACKHGAHGAQHDEALMSAPWDCDSAEIPVRTHL
jgi:hypothetical protein